MGDCGDTQEYLAEFIVDGVDACIVAEPQHAGPYVMGVDWGKRDDFTVLTVLDKLTGHVVAAYAHTGYRPGWEGRPCS